MKITKYLVIIFIFINNVLAAADSPILSLEQFLNLAEQNDPDFEKVIADKIKMDFVVDQGLPTRQLLLSIVNEYGISSDSAQDTSDLSISLSKEIIESGTTLSVTQTNTDRTAQKGELTEFRVEQSLYKNFLGRDVRLKKESLNKERDSIEFQVLENYEDYIAAITKKYLDYGQAYLNINLAQKIHQEAVNLQKNVLEKRDKNIATRTDVDRVNLQLLLKKEDLINKQTQLDSQKQQVKRIIGDQNLILMPELDLDFTKKFAIDLTQEKLSWDNLRAYNVSAINQDVAANNLLLEQRGNSPSLSLVAGYNIEKSERYSSTVNTQEKVIGVKLDIPIGDSLQNANIKSASLDFTKTKLDKKSFEKDIEKQFTDLKNQLIQSKETMEISGKKVEIVERILQDEEKRYLYGKIELEDLIKIKNDFAAYRFQYYSDLITYNKIVLDWLNLNDSLLKKKRL